MEGALGRFAAACLLAALCACAPSGPKLRVRPPEIPAEQARQERAAHYDGAMRRLRAYRERLDRVFDPIAAESAELCGEQVVPWLGVATVAPREFSDWSPHLETQAELREAAQRVLAMGSTSTVFVVTPGSPAAAAGLRTGDRIERANDREVDTAKKLRRALRESRHGALRLALRRGDETRQLEIPYRASCDARLGLSLVPDVFAYWHREGIWISTGMMDQLASDTELAFVLAHELAHQIQNRGHGNPKQLERDADYLGLYLVARAGHDVSGLPALWRRWAEIAPFGITHQGASHPGTPERSLLLEATAGEIEEKRAAGRPLLPELAP